MADVADILERAAKLIEPEGAWTQGSFASAASGKPTGSIWNDNASCFCIRGAIARIAGALYSGAAIFATRVILGNDDQAALARWNDAPERTQAEVVAKLREAAAKAREQGL